jgi:hypothetical protein
MTLAPAAASLAALLLAIVLSFSARVNVGLAALGLAFALGLFVPGLRAETVAGAFPAVPDAPGVTSSPPPSQRLRGGGAPRLARGDARGALLLSRSPSA